MNMRSLEVEVIVKSFKDDVFRIVNKKESNFKILENSFDRLLCMLSDSCREYQDKNKALNSETKVNKEEICKNTLNEIEQLEKSREERLLKDKSDLSSIDKEIEKLYKKRIELHERIEKAEKDTSISKKVDHIKEAEEKSLKELVKQDKVKENRLCLKSNAAIKSAWNDLSAEPFKIVNDILTTLSKCDFESKYPIGGEYFKSCIIDMSLELDNVKKNFDALNELESELEKQKSEAIKKAIRKEIDSLEQQKFSLVDTLGIINTHKLIQEMRSDLDYVTN
jgi:hypothetical protein